MTNRLTRWWMPDLALTVAVVACGFCLLDGDGPQRLFRDSDTGWHIRTGERLLAGGPLPSADPYSFSRAGKPWLAWEWGADVVMGFCHRLGLPGVAALYTILLGACVWGWFQLHWRFGGNFFIAALLAGPMIGTLSLHWLARPHVFGWLLALSAVWILEGGGGRFRYLAGFGFVLYGAVWAALHGSFFLLPLLAVTYVIGGQVGAWMWGEEYEAAWHLKAALCFSLGTLINPYGQALHAHVFSYLSNGELLSRIGEFQSFNFHVDGAWQVLLAVLVCAAGGTVALVNRKPAHFLLAAGILIMAMRSARALPLLALLILPLANAAITKAISTFAPLKPLLDYAARVRLLDARCGGLAFIPLIALVLAIALQSPALARKSTFPASEFPVEAAQAVERLSDSARILAPDKFGGYLIYRFNGRRKVFFDGRSDFYGVDFMKDYIRLIEARPGWREQVERHGFTHALLPNNYSLVEGFNMLGWTRIHQDATSTLFEHRARVTEPRSPGSGH